MSGKIGYFGKGGSFSHRAAMIRFSNPGWSKVSFHSYSLIDQAFDALVRKEVSAIVVPIENASSGTITDTVDQLIRIHSDRETQDGLVRECLSMPIHLVLVGVEGSESSIKTIYSHRAALTHARSWLTTTYPTARLVEAESTSQAALFAKEQPETAALAGEQVAEEYGLAVLRRDVQEAIANRTKFYVVGDPLADSNSASHTSLVFEAAHRPGSLAVALNSLAVRGLNLTMIHSRPIPGRFDEYRFIIEFENGGREEEAIQALRGETDSLSVLGSYPIVNLASMSFR